ncbi:uncharacterized protein LOC129597008 [Paramacrobiotus metropolitanus]|uniref:uncharacterized protein LOC129597008 n=1 Tax=Paramacrobiotus metropolitanus TaxID=2943436 RepID=UPI00244563B9|nr:uncharacterized protein LOC129597008 [Paramacrobiotus metropolitanus]
MSLLKLSLLLALAVVCVAALKGDDESNQVAFTALYMGTPDMKPPPLSWCGGKYGHAKITVNSYTKKTTKDGTLYEMNIDLDAKKSGSSEAESMKGRPLNVLKKADGKFYVKKNPCEGPG